MVRWKSWKAPGATKVVATRRQYMRCLGSDNLKEAYKTGSPGLMRKYGRPCLRKKKSLSPVPSFGVNATWSLPNVEQSQPVNLLPYVDDAGTV